MKNISRSVIIFSVVLSQITVSFAQDRVLNNEKYKHSVSDSLFNEFSNGIYHSFYTSSYMSTTTPTFTMLKVDISKNGKVTSIQFSDSADSTFVKAYLNRKKWHDDKATLEKYAKIKSYTDVSLLIPVSWEPDYPNQKKLFSYDEMEGIMRFNKKDFTGKSVFFPPIYIKITPGGNM
ncbi:hypothetical protein [Mucilaginibacter sp.]|jgi:hypothetical protein|uniref:hypothetical protein n=1 Tax=Mucilaginibacter sp. TaxID=1882438 RepID=UPI0026213E12|nr:hypothetical protein [Mucilaginibacter sp.]MDB5129969.1 hypothetical protein [Mucilaginibacter sp.]